ncbi:hypothetical protein Scep_002343 [Stephania cephalantha]|uniref:Uncharacterized protein n=1 Tax=Stephania cephalantha TaxID=152367 RepID=A0AAP0Q476_9MAGN
MPIDETELYLSVVERDDKGRTYGLGWTPSGPKRRQAGAGSSRPMSANDELIEQLRGTLKKYKETLIDRLGISFAPPADAYDDSESDHDLDD